MAELKQLRKELGITQAALAKRANVPWRTYARAEAGGTVHYSTAKKLLDAINAVRSEQGKEAITLNELGLTIS